MHIFCHTLSAIISSEISNLFALSWFYIVVFLYFQEIEQERAAMAEYEKRIRAEGRAAAEKAVAAAQPNDHGVFFASLSTSVTFCFWWLLWLSARISILRGRITSHHTSFKVARELIVFAERLD